MEEIISKAEFNELMKLKGEGRGVGIKSNVEFVVKEEGEEAREKLEAALAKVGYPIKYEEIGSTSFYPLVLDALTLIVIKRLFNYDDRKFQEMGRHQAKYPPILRRFVPHFFSIERITTRIAKFWEVGFTVGTLHLTSYDKRKKNLILQVKDFNLHPLYCQVLMGLFSGALEVMVGGEVAGKETKCLHRGEGYHEFVLKW